MPESNPTMPVDAVIKLGGSIFTHSDLFDAAIAAIDHAAEEHRFLVVPGGGPFVDAIRDIDSRLRLTSYS